MFLAGKKRRDLSSRPLNHLRAQMLHKFSSFYILNALDFDRRIYIFRIIYGWREKNWNSRRSNELKCISGDINQKSARESTTEKWRRPESGRTRKNVSILSFATNCIFVVDNAAKSEKFFWRKNSSGNS